MHCCNLFVQLQITIRLPSCTVFIHFIVLELVLLGLIICWSFLLFIDLLLNGMF